MHLHKFFLTSCISLQHLVVLLNKINSMSIDLMIKITMMVNQSFNDNESTRHTVNVNDNEMLYFSAHDILYKDIKVIFDTTLNSYRIPEFCHA